MGGGAGPVSGPPSCVSLFNPFKRPQRLVSPLRRALPPPAGVPSRSIQSPRLCFQVEKDPRCEPKPGGRRGGPVGRGGGVEKGLGCG